MKIRAPFKPFAAALALALVSASAVASEEPPVVAAPRAECGPGSDPEPGRQGRVTAADLAERSELDRPFTCNTSGVARVGDAAGYKVLRYVDASGNECAYYDTTFVFPSDVLGNVSDGRPPSGVYVLDMADPAQPRHVATLSTPAMSSPHESLVLSERRGLLAAVMGNPATLPGIVDLYDVSADCRSPQLMSSTPLGILGHESGFAPDGNTFYAASLITGNVTALDVSNPLVPRVLWSGEYSSHGLSISDDGTRAYMAALNVDGAPVPEVLRNPDEDPNSAAVDPGLVIVDVSDVQNRNPVPMPRTVATLTWEPGSTPQNAIPVTIGGHPYLVEIDEFAGKGFPDPPAPPGAARIIDIADETDPKVVSNIRLEVHQPENRAEQMDDPGADNGTGGYSGHYCNVPKRDDPGIVACSFILSGLRVFDISDPFAPREIAYFNHPRGGSSAFAMSQPAFAPERSEIWYTDGSSGFHVVRLTNGVWPS